MDGAAFGSEMKEINEYLVVRSDVVLYAPESFEFVIFKSNHKQCKYTTNKYQISYYLTNGNHFYIRKNDTNKDIKSEMYKMFETIKRKGFIFRSGSI